MEEKKMNNLETKLNEAQSFSERQSPLEKTQNYLKGCVDPQNARLYGTFQERAALNITQFPKIQGSLLIRMGMVYPLMSYITDKLGIPQDASSDFFGMTVNYHTWIAGYLAYVAEIQAGLSKYPLEFVASGAKKVREYFADRKSRFEKAKLAEKVAKKSFCESWNMDAGRYWLESKNPKKAIASYRKAEEYFTKLSNNSDDEGVALYGHRRAYEARKTARRINNVLKGEWKGLGAGKV